MKIAVIFLTHLRKNIYKTIYLITETSQKAFQKGKNPENVAASFLSLELDTVNG